MVAPVKNGRSILLKTFGCSLNQSDSEVMAGLLNEAGYEILNKDGNARPDLVIINTCSVKGLAEKKFYRELAKWKSSGTRIVVAGCIPQADPDILSDKLKDFSVLGTRQLIHVVDIVNDALNGIVVHNIGNDQNERLNLPKIRKTGIIEILPISEGCLSNCSYCKTKFARGELLSYQKEKIIQQFKSALAEGCKEFWITSQDNGCYGFDIYRKEKYFLPQLLNDLLAIEGDFRIRLGMSNPDHVLRIKDELIKTFRHPKIFKFLHIPVQSGNDAVLRTMKRHYTVQDFKRLVKEFRDDIPGITISTDLIAGFPEETEEEFNDTLSLVKDLKVEIVNFSRFWLRKGTAAEKLEQVHGNISKVRSEQLKATYEQVAEETKKRWFGKVIVVLIDEVGKHGVLIGRNDSYVQVLVKDAAMQLGSGCRVLITGTRIHDIIGVPVDINKLYK